MTRLTRRNPDGGINVEGMTAALDKLAAYEDAEEQGRLVRLPRKVGGTVFQIGGRGPCEPLRIYESAVKSLIFDTTAGFAFDERAIGKTVFLTREEAEAALQSRNAAQ